MSRRDLAKLQYPESKSKQRRLRRFHGGVHLPDEKALSTGRPLGEAPLPNLLTIPLQQHIGLPAKALVRKGERVLRGQLIAEPQGHYSASIHASSSGTVLGIEQLPLPHPSGLSGPCIVIRTDGLDEWGRLPEPITDPRKLDHQVVRERIRSAGIVGLGGASFPTSVKIDPGPQQPIRTLIVNGAECEPYISCDDMLMRHRSRLIVQGASIIMRLLGAQECLIGIEDNKPQAIREMTQAVSQSDIAESASVCTIPTLYPSGGEKQLIYILTGKEVSSSAIPAHIGILCQNVATLAAVAEAVIDGKPLISRFVTLSGRAIRRPQNLEVRIGTPVSDLIAAAGGLAGKAQRLVMGGPMMGFTLSGEQVPVVKATNCILALSSDEAPDPGPALPCIRCGKCAEVCPASLLPQQMYWYARSKDIDKVQDYNLFDCIECGCCSHVCPSHIPLVQYYRYAKTESWTREREKRAAEHARQRHEARSARLMRLEQERQAKLRQRKEALAPKQGAQKPSGTADKPAEPLDAKKAAIEAARKRAAAKKAALAEKGVAPKNTTELTAAQQRQIDAANRRRQGAPQAPAGKD